MCLCFAGVYKVFWGEWEMLNIYIKVVTQKNPFIKWGMQQVVFLHNQLYIIWKRREKIRLHKSIFIYFFILLFCSFLFTFSAKEKVCFVLFTEWKIVIMPSTFQLFLELCNSINFCEFISYQLEWDQQQKY